MVGIVTTGLLERMLSEQELGAYFLALSIVSLGAIVGSLTRTWNLEIKSLCQWVSARFSTLRIWLTQAESFDWVFRDVSCCSALLVSN